MIHFNNDGLSLQHMEIMQKYLPIIQNSTKMDLFQLIQATV